MQEILHRRYSDPAWIATIVTILLSVWLIISGGLINSDGVLYIEVADKILHGDWLASVKQYSWPFYSLIIAAISKLTYLETETSSYVLNVFLQALFIFMFVRCVQALGGKDRVAWFAAILILTNVIMNGYRELIIRDHGYWAFFITALYFFLQYHRLKAIKYAIAFGVSIIIATLFRIEGIVFLFLAPLLMLFEDRKYKQNLYKVGWLLSPMIFFVCVGLVYIIFSGATFDSFGRISDPFAYLQSAYSNLVSGLAEKGRILEETVLLQNSRSMGTKSMLAILLMIFVAKVISATGIITLLFSALSYRAENIRDRIIGLNIINGFMIINVFILVVFVLSHSFLSPRYTMTMAILITLPAAFSLSDFMKNSIHDTKLKKRVRLLVVVLLVYMFLDSVTSFGASKQYVKEAGIWLRNNTAEDVRILANDRLIYYYANKPLDTNALSSIVEDAKRSQALNINKGDYDYLAIEISRKQKTYRNELIEWLGSQPVYQASNKRNDSIVIFKLN